MSKESLATLNHDVLIGYTEKRGTAWHYRAEEQGPESNHYTGPIPVEDVKRRLFNWTAIEGEITATALTETGVLSVTDPDRKAIMRSDTGAIMGIFKSGYRPHQYQEWLMQNVATLLDADLAIGSAGLLSGGAKAWVQIEMEDTLEVEGVQFRPWLTAATSFDGSLATTFLRGSQLVICDNTLSCALGNFDGRHKVRHSTNSLSRIGEIRQALSIIHQVADDFSDQVRELVAIPVTDRDFQRFLSAHLELTQEKLERGGRSLTIARNKQDALTRLWKFDARVSPWHGNAFGVLQAVNTYTHHEGTVKNASRAERNADRAITGGVDSLDRDTLKTLQLVLG